jgi:hypothetical protein
MYSSGVNNAPSFFAHSKQCSWRLCSILELFSVDLLKTSAFTSITKSKPDAGAVGMLQVSIRM